MEPKDLKSEKGSTQERELLYLLNSSTEELGLFCDLCFIFEAFFSLTRCQIKP